MVVQISYADLVSSPSTLTASIEQAFGSSETSLGIILITDLPSSFPIFRERLFKMAHRFANLPKDTRAKYEDSTSNYSFGWSHGKEIMNGRPDLLKGSFYANPVVDSPDVSDDSRREFPQYYGSNIWPSIDEAGVEGFEAAFKDLGKLIFRIGCELAIACQPFAATKLTDSTVSLHTMLADSLTTKARLLHYFPPSPEQSANEADDNYCGIHRDHGFLTGLCSSMFLAGLDNPDIVQPPSPDTGLYIQTRGGVTCKVSIPTDCLAFQTGEALEVATAGHLRATPHYVRIAGITEAAAANISRETFALFMQPNTEQVLDPSTGQTFGQFSKAVFKEHYN